MLGLRRALECLRGAGCRFAYIDGSFVTAKDVPGDFDGCWDTDNVDGSKLDPVLLRFDNRRAAQKAKYLGELFPAQVQDTTTGLTFIEFFQLDKDTGRPKGIVALDLGRL